MLSTIMLLPYKVHSYHNIGDNALSIFYSGSKDGQVKVGSVKNEKIEFVGGILAHTQSVNAISPL